MTHALTSQSATSLVPALTSQVRDFTTHAPSSEMRTFVSFSGMQQQVGFVLTMGYMHAVLLQLLHVVYPKQDVCTYAAFWYGLDLFVSSEIW